MQLCMKHKYKDTYIHTYMYIVRMCAYILSQSVLLLDQFQAAEIGKVCALKFTFIYLLLYNNRRNYLCVHTHIHTYTVHARNSY